MFSGNDAYFGRKMPMFLSFFCRSVHKWTKYAHIGKEIEDVAYASLPKCAYYMRFVHTLERKGKKMSSK